ncbi:hypothetical protein ACH4VR_40785 [Streptomyces sp. NPDC020883]|uniref:hypothetical protein n=1 Tax=Streptomyces sp. NPDC020883 TaxID=3365099 RepID=UPI0037902535
MRNHAWVGYARSHYAFALTIGLLVLTVCNIAFGSQALELPFQYGNPAAGIPMRRELPIAFAALAAGSLHSKMTQFEFTATRVLRQYETQHLLAVFVTTTLLVGGTELAIEGVGKAIVLTRALWIWLGLALLSGRLFGRLLSWILPVATIFPLTYLGQDELGRDRWWEWTSQPASSAACWSITVAVTVTGLAAFYLTPWHWHSLRVRRSHASSTRR